ncbi:MAG TPA: hypothetical protein VG271_09410 [Beijerinckiaceae bacterium]|nr:hypothetical protein [Beijerinckiaceae bacterium]
MPYFGKLSAFGRSGHPTAARDKWVALAIGFLVGKATQEISARAEAHHEYRLRRVLHQYAVPA